MSDDIVERLRVLTATLRLRDFQGLAETTNEAADEIERLRAERDEARHGESVAIATLQGVIEERRMIRFERDEARVEVCRLSARCVRADYLLRIKNPKHVTEYDVAESRGWHDLFADEGKHERTT